jgi:hypothetical protein
VGSLGPFFGAHLFGFLAQIATLDVVLGIRKKDGVTIGLPSFLSRWFLFLSFGCWVSRPIPESRTVVYGRLRAPLCKE